MANIVLTPPSTGEISQYYANSSERGVHSGNDYKYLSGGKIHDKALAMADGVVEWADDTRKLGWPNKYYFNPDFDRSDNVDHSAGIAVVLRHWFGWTTYCHLYTTPLNIGDSVNRGEYVGTVGETGFSYGKHLHAELILNDHDFNTPTGGRADLNKYMVDFATVGSIEAPAPQEIEKDWFEMADEAMLEKVVRRVVQSELGTLKPGISGKNHNGEHYNQFMKAMKALLISPEVMDKQALHLLTRPINLIDPTANSGKVTGTTNLATKASWEAYNFQKALNLLLSLAEGLKVILKFKPAVTEDTIEVIPDTKK